MKLSELHVDNFKAAAGLRLDLSDMTALVGVNGSGKTTILEALEHFFRGTDIPQSSYRDPGKPVTISVRFIQIPRAKRSALITRTWAWADGECVIDTKARGLRLSDLDSVLGSVHMVFERAEHETGDGGTGRSELDFARLIEATVNEEIAKADLTAMLAQSNERYQSLKNSIVEFREIMNQKLEGGANALTADIVARIPDPEPCIEARFVERGAGLSHRPAGHGTKRAYRMAALEAHAETLSKKGSGHLVLMLVDEPELHQHPKRLPRILQAYKRLAGMPSAQIVYATHSPGLVDLGRPEGVYRVSRGPESGMVATPGDRLAPRRAGRSARKKLVEAIFSAEAPHGDAPRVRAVARRRAARRTRRPRASPRGAASVPVWLQAAGILVGIAAGVAVIVGKAAHLFR